MLESTLPVIRKIKLASFFGKHFIVGSYPYYDKDPFIIKECPHVYFAGNQPEFKHDIVTG